MIKLPKKHDIHVHTNLSSCGDKDAFVAGYIDLCIEKGIELIGFSDHLWDEKVKGASNWYMPQNIDHVLKIKKDIPENSPVKILIGCEVEYLGGGILSISKESADIFDFILVPSTHFHMKDFVCPKELKETKAVARLMVDRFLEICSLDIATGFAHQFIPIGFMERDEEILSSIENAAYEECFKEAALKNISIEIHKSMLSYQQKKSKDRFPLEYVRELSIAKDCGCKFHFGSDAHRYNSFEKHEELIALAEYCGIKELDFAV